MSLQPSRPPPALTLVHEPPELAADVIDKGIMLTGGVAMLGNLSQVLGTELGLKVNIADDPMSAGVLGAGHLLESHELLPRATID